MCLCSSVSASNAEPSLCLGEEGKLEAPARDEAKQLALVDDIIIPHALVIHLHDVLPCHVLVDVGDEGGELVVLEHPIAVRVVQVEELP